MKGKDNHHLSFMKITISEKSSLLCLTFVFIKRDKHIYPHPSLNVPACKAYQEQFPQ
jgi:hypothetical protein